MIVASLDPVRIVEGDLWVEGGRVAEAGHRHADRHRRRARPPRQRLRAHAPLLGARARDAVRARAAARLPRRSSSASGGGSTARSTRPRSAPRRSSAGWRRSSPGRRRSIDHHASPNAIDGSLDVIEEALRGLGVRSVLCYETSDRDGPGARRRRARREPPLPRARVRREQPPLTRALVGAHASFTLSDETLAACAEVGPLHVHAAEDGVDRGAVARLARLGALGEDTLLAHGVHLGEEELALVRTRERLRRPQRPLEHEQRRRHAPGRRLRRRGSRSAPTGSARTCSRSPGPRSSACARTTSAPVADWPLARLAESARLAGRVFDEPLLGTLEPGAPADLVVLDYAAPAPLTRVELRRPLGLRALAAGRSAT